MPIDLGANALTQNTIAQSKKPSYLITLEDTSSKKADRFQRFISLDKPELLNGFIQVKGIFSDKSEDEIIKTFVDILTNSSKELILEMMFPMHRICSIRNLVFNAVKTVTKAPIGENK